MIATLRPARKLAFVLFRLSQAGLQSRSFLSFCNPLCEVPAMFQFMPDEMVVDYAGPFGYAHGLKTCSECTQVAFRVLHLKSEGVQREVALCGGHFMEACARYPELFRAAGLRLVV
jgi:hypothetical protein